MLSSVFRLLRQYSRFLVVRIALFALLALVAVGASVFFGSYIPQNIAGFVGVEAMDAILTTLASSMLAVTTFSLSIMAAAFQGASAAMTPRARLVLRQDRETQSVLATFVGAFVFSLVTIVLRATPLVGEKERFLLFCATVAVVVFVLVAMVRWIRRLETLGANDDTVLKLQTRAETAMTAFAKAPAHGAHIWTDAAREAMQTRPCLKAQRSGYVQQIMEDLLQEQAERADILVYIAVRTGEYVVAGQPVVYWDGPERLPDSCARDLLGAVFIQERRDFEQDPALGVSVLTEVASRALSPAVNDTQTAVDVIHRLASVMLCAAQDEARILHERVWVLSQSLEEMFAASFDVIARDGDGKAEIMSALIQALSQIERFGSPDLAALSRACRARLTA